MQQDVQVIRVEHHHEHHHVVEIRDFRQEEPLIGDADEALRLWSEAADAA